MNTHNFKNALIIGIPLLFGSTLVEAQRVQDSISVLCRLNSSKVWSKIYNQRIIISWLDCTVKWDDSVLYKSIEQIMRITPEYQSAIVITYWREMKPNQKLSKKEDRFTDTFVLKIDFNHKKGKQTTTEWFIYNPASWLTNISIEQAMAATTGIPLK